VKRELISSFTTPLLEQPFFCSNLLCTRFVCSRSSRTTNFAPFLPEPRRTRKTAESGVNQRCPHHSSGKDIKRKWVCTRRQRAKRWAVSPPSRSILAGKLNVLYTPISYGRSRHSSINAEKIVLTGLKSDQKLYRRYTGFPGGLREKVLHQIPRPSPRSHRRSRPSRACCPSPSRPSDGHQVKVYKGATGIRTSPSSPLPWLFSMPSNAPKVLNLK